MNEVEKLELHPDPIRMVEGLRDTGYQFVTAIADIIDNSVAADADKIHVKVNMNLKGEVLVSIFDDGIGMNRDGIINAMKYGSKPRESAASLGKFGLGLKTASTAFCRRLVVISRESPDSDLLKAVWDLDHIGKASKWELHLGIATPSERKDFLETLGDTNGTLVKWEKVDRLMRPFLNPTGVPAKKAYQKLLDELRFHLSIVFQRFLDHNDKRARNIVMMLNGVAVNPWDPFVNGYSEVINEDSPEVELGTGNLATFQMKAFVLPRSEDFDDPQVAKKAQIGNQMQGIYIYRENRLIHGPDWLKMFSKEPHLSLLRVEFSFDHKLDEAFQIDIKKSQIILNESLYDHVHDFLTPARRHADEVYRKGKKARASEASKDAHDGSNRNISLKEGQIKAPQIGDVDAVKGEADLVNNNGKIRLKLKITSATKPQEVFIQPVDSIEDGILWEPCRIDGHWGVRINTGHPYYHKVYIPNINEGVTIQGMDSLFWGLALAELNCISESTKNTFSDLRFEVSRTLRKLVEDLPEPKDLE